MKVSARCDIDAPPAAVFAALCDFPRYEAQARARGAEVTRLDGGARPATAAWRIVAALRGVRRPIAVRVVTCDPPDQLALRAENADITATINSEVMARPAGGSTLFVSLDARPATLTARLLLRSLTIGEGPLAAWLDRRLDRFARLVESRAAAAG